MWSASAVPAQEVAGKIILEIAADGVDVVGTVLGVVVLHQHGRTVDAVVVRVTRLLRTGTGEVQMVEAGGIEALQLPCGGVVRHPAGVHR